MNDPNRHHIDHAIETALDRAFAQSDRRIREEYLTEDAATELIQSGGDEAVADAWREWIGGDS